jgi:hypothetical protein
MLMELLLRLYILLHLLNDGQELMRWVSAQCSPSPCVMGGSVRDDRGTSATRPQVSFM